MNKKWVFPVAVVASIALASMAGAQTIKVKTFPMSSWTTSEGYIKLPFTYETVQAEELDRLRLSADFKPYFNYLTSLTRQLGHDANCGSRNLAFLPGTTEADFRKAQNTWLKLLETPTAKNTPMQRYRQTGREVSTDGIFSAESVVYRKTNVSGGDKYEWLHVYTFVYNKKLQNGVLLTCESPKIL